MAERTAKPAAARKQIAQTAGVFSPGIASIGVALGCNLTWVMMAFQSLGIFHDQPDPERVLDATYLISIVTSILTYLVVAALHDRARTLLGTIAARVAFPLGISLSTVAMLFGTTTTGAGAACIVVGGIGSGVFTSLFMMHFGVALSMLRTKFVVAVCAIGYTVSTLLFAVYLFFGPLEATIFCASMPPIAGVLLAHGVNALRLQKQQEIDPLPAQQDPESPDDRKQLAELVRAFSACMLISGFVYELARTVYIQVGNYANLGVADYAVSQGVMAGVVTLASIGITLAIVASRNTRAPEFAYRAFIFFLVLSALLLMTPLVFPDVPAAVPLSVNVASFQCLNMMMWALVCGVCNQYLSSCVRTFALFRASWAAGPLLGMLVGRALYFEVGLTMQSAFVASAGCVLLLFVLSNFVFTEAKLQRALNVLPIERRRRFQDRCQAVIERYGLTEREGEIMTMFAKGRNLPYVMDELCLSKSTVSTHRQHIYKKLGVHSAQEMLDLIQREG